MDYIALLYTAINLLFFYYIVNVAVNRAKRNRPLPTKMALVPGILNFAILHIHEYHAHAKIMLDVDKPLITLAGLGLLTVIGARFILHLPEQ